jgi:CO/xanthine dehydrogenase FAD-binding subunit
MVAALLQIKDGKVLEGRIAVGSCSTVARRLEALEGELIGAPVRDGLNMLVRPEHLHGLSPIDDVRATAEYRLDAVLRLVQRALNSCVESG